MDKLDKITKEVLMLWIPCPLGEGMLFDEIAEHLNISSGEISKILNNFRISFPDGWDNIMSIFRSAKRSANRIKNTIPFESHMEIKEKF